MYGYIYLTTNKANNMRYVGQHRAACFEPNKYMGSGFKLQEAIEEFGAENFVCELVEVCCNKEEIDRREIYWIAYYRKKYGRHMLYNVANGGFSFDDDSLAKGRQITAELHGNGKIAGHLHTDEMMEARAEKYNGDVMGMCHTAEAVENNRRAIIKNWGYLGACLNTPESRANNKAVIVGRYGSMTALMNTPEGRQHKDETFIKKYGTRAGRLNEKEIKEMAAAALAESVGIHLLVKFPNGAKKVFRSASQAGRALHVGSGTLTKWARGTVTPKAETLERIGVLSVELCD